MANLAPISVRVSAHERELLEEAAEYSCTNLSDFIRSKALEAAECEIFQRAVVTIPAAEWERFEAWADEPPRSVDALRELAATRPAWQE